MTFRETTLEINGHIFWVGTSLYHTRTNEVFWYRGVKEGQVQLEGVQANVELPLTTFRKKVTIGDLEPEP